MKKIMFIMAFLACTLVVNSAFGARLNHEKWYQEQWCNAKSGVQEYVLPDRTRVDCLTETHAWEFDFGDKWAEAPGQSLYYAIQTGKRAGIVLILEEEKDRKYWIRLNTIIEYFGLPIDAITYGPASRPEDNE